MTYDEEPGHDKDLLERNGMSEECVEPGCSNPVSIQRIESGKRKCVSCECGYAQIENFELEPEDERTYDR